MKIKSITSQSRRDFNCVYECEHCGHAEEGVGYDDENFHVNVIPAMACDECGEKSPANYRPLQPKYTAHEVV
ncbi:MAG: hypothetical protein COA78_25120 [Blastopirellula sp.]|nr:MAG: hypothetical protein COA78_25120 [Blastopirellula sp.]